MATLQNIGKLKYRGKDGQWHPLPVVVQDAGGGVSTISGKGQPTESTVGRLNQLYRDESTDKLYICTGVDGGYTWAAVVSDTEDAVKYTAQTLTNAQKQQARTNIGAGTSNFSGSYNDLTNTPVLDTTLEQSGKPADAKAVGDAIGAAIEATTTILGASKVDKSQGTENAGKILGIGASGIVTPVDKPVYTLPIATPTALGGVMPVAKTTAMTQGVGVSEDGKLYTAPSGGGTDKSLGITSAKVGQIAKITAVDAQGKPTGWEAVDMPSGGDSGGLRNIDLIVDHIVTAEEVTAIRLTWDTTKIPELGKYNLFYAVISSQTAFSFTKWAEFRINNDGVARFSGGTSTPKVKKLPISVNRYFGRWIGTNVYKAIDSSVFPLIAGENEMTLNTTHENNVDATSIGIGSYGTDFGLTEGMSIKIYAMV